ncbi:spore coat polysaccharide biosynthesis protein SpsF [Solirubrobacter pauli]|uniref:Spore coat polysaccharide biosynthesis protein SpsF n=1 Tax=Solirubrobacter pauli TaxID=166793 RepID=A0A660LCQ4_9ACTN|nr:glycosyltransferase family protein [Solirubrobacter pauli]RKQ92349.1 spore coat polysaccharide biosynthesis protein SpsF [Solirubrobacter pauli]
MRTVATIEARMTSSRLPGKVLLPAAGKPLLEHMIERLRRVPELDEVVIATTEDASSEPLQELADRLGVGCFRGSEDDVLARVLGAAQAYDAELIVETTGDCPLIDPATVSRVIERFHATGVDYCSNNLERTFPRGMDTQAFPTAVLAEVATLTQDPHDREHVSLYIYEHPERYSLETVRFERPETGALRLTVDTEEDYELVRTIFDELYPANPAFGLTEILALLDARPELAAINQHIEQKAIRPT